MGREKRTHHIHALQVSVLLVYITDSAIRSRNISTASPRFLSDLATRATHCHRSVPHATPTAFLPWATLTSSGVILHLERHFWITHCWTIWAARYPCHRCQARACWRVSISSDIAQQKERPVFGVSASLWCMAGVNRAVEPKLVSHRAPWLLKRGSWCRQPRWSQLLAVTHACISDPVTLEHWAHLQRSSWPLRSPVVTKTIRDIFCRLFRVIQWFHFTTGSWKHKVESLQESLTVNNSLPAWH